MNMQEGRQLASVILARYPSVYSDSARLAAWAAEFEAMFPGTPADTVQQHALAACRAMSGSRIPSVEDITRAVQAALDSEAYSQRRIVPPAASDTERRRNMARARAIVWVVEQHISEIAVIYRSVETVLARLSLSPLPSRSKARGLALAYGLAIISDDGRCTCDCDSTMDACDGAFEARRCTFAPGKGHSDATR